jgi:molybdopterin-binding protein
MAPGYAELRDATKPPSKDREPVENRLVSPHLRRYGRRMQSFRVSQAAQLLGVSDDTVRRWIDQGELAVGEGRPIEVPGDALAAKAIELASAPAAPDGTRSSARNRFVGLVVRVQRDGVMAQVDIQAGPHRVVSLLSAEAVDELGLEVGSLAAAVVKATNVVVETPSA